MMTVEEQLAKMRQQIETLQRENGGNDIPDQDQLLRLDAYRAPKLPPFYKKDPTLWFAQVEATFRNAKITGQLTQADTVITALDPDAAAVISDLIHAPDREKLYDKIKERMLAAFFVSAESKLRQLLKGQFATDGKPSLFLARMRNNNHGAACSDTVLKSIFIFHFHRKSSRSRSRSISQPQHAKQAGFCWRHKRFGAQAHKCEQPCT